VVEASLQPLVPAVVRDVKALHLIVELARVDFEDVFELLVVLGVHHFVSGHGEHKVFLLWVSPHVELLNELVRVGCQRVLLDVSGRQRRDRNWRFGDRLGSSFLGVVFLLYFLNIAIAIFQIDRLML